MSFKVTKVMALVLAIVMAVLSVYTLVIGVRLAYCSWSVSNSEAVLSRTSADEVYKEAQAIRNDVKKQNGYANFIYGVNMIFKLLIFVMECAITYVCFILWLVLRMLEKNMTKKNRQLRRRT